MWYEAYCSEKGKSNVVISDQRGRLGVDQQLLAALAIVGARTNYFNYLERAETWGEDVASCKAYVDGVSLERELTLDGFELYADNMLLCGREGTNRAEMTFSITIVE